MPDISRRDVLKGTAAGALTPFAVEGASAEESKRYIVGCEPGEGSIAKDKADSIHRVIEFGDDIGEAVVGKWSKQELEALRNNPHVKYVEEDERVIETHAHPGELQWGVDRIDAEIAHAAGDTGSSIDIAILDTGIDADHPDLQGNLGAGHSPEDCQDSFHPSGSCANDWDDDDGHGTHVAGIANAIHNGTNVIGTSTEATLHAVKVCRQFTAPDGSTATTCPNSSVAQGIVTASNQGYDVINMSLGACCPSCGTVGDGTGDCDDCFNVPSVIDSAIQTAKNNDVVVIASAGNDGNRPDCDGDGDTVCGDNDCVSTPAKHPDVIAVSSTTINDGLSGFSSVGSEIDLAAPGSSIPSTWNTGGVAILSGTSMAAPHVTGAAAQLLADSTSPGNVRSELKSNAEDIGLAGYEQGGGLLDLAAALGHSTANDLLEVETDFASSITRTSATLNGELTQLVGSPSADVFFEWGPGSGPPFPNTAAAGNRTSPSSFTASISGLSDDTSFQFRAGATNDGGTGSTEYGDIRSFSTDANATPHASFTV
ncbi:MAG: S8 family serine peptidase, partial [Halobacteriales archaeon]